MNALLKQQFIDNYITWWAEYAGTHRLELAQQLLDLHDLMPNAVELTIRATLLGAVLFAKIHDVRIDNYFQDSLYEDIIARLRQIVLEPPVVVVHSTKPKL